MDVMERGHTFLKKANKYYNILVTSLSYHFNGKTISMKNGPLRCVNVITRG
jgi:hypothetical protein